MKTLARFAILVLVLFAGAFAQSEGPAPESNPAFTQAELDQMLAPIALYPDALLSQVLMAATYPLEVVEAARWSYENPGLEGDAAVQAVADQEWDPSVKSLVAFPQVLQTMDQKLQWTRRLGDAFLAQQAQVMDTVQNLRRKAEEAGNLGSNAQIEVTQDDGAIGIEPANPEIVYVPYYNPVVIYGPWWWPDYAPFYWAPWPGYGWYGGFAWGIGIVVGVDFFFGHCDWHDHHVNIYDRRNWFPRHGGDGHGPPYAWRHDPGHRYGVPYRDASLDRQFGRFGARDNAQPEFRGRTPPAGFNLPQPGASPPVTGLSQRPGLSRPIPQSPRIGTVPGIPNRPSVEPRPNAFEGVPRGSDTRGFSARGNQSVRSMPARPAPPPVQRPAPAPRPPQHH
ncbi:MAG TPA: DUF3300 domain-containing protein [Rudaea sp.]|nr:DUF3300 domain-containing protein [Rudaea sp.]